jgi:hypothetical protein
MSNKFIALISSKPLPFFPTPQKPLPKWRIWGINTLLDSTNPVDVANQCLYAVFRVVGAQS